MTTKELFSHIESVQSVYMRKVELYEASFDTTEILKNETQGFVLVLRDILNKITDIKEQAK